ncbi:MAG: hypothetical protein ABF315_03065, partial [Lentimonas sp.]
MKVIATVILTLSLLSVIGCSDKPTPKEVPAPKPEQQPIPEPEIVVIAEPEVTTTPEPTAKSIPEPKITLDPLEWIQGNWRGSIRSVTITKEQSVPVYADGQQVGDAILPVGREVEVQKINETTVTIHFLNNLHLVPANATDLETRAAKALSSAQNAALNPKQETTDVVNQTKTPEAHNFITISTLKDLVKYAALDGNDVKLPPGTYQMADILNTQVIEKIREDAINTSKDIGAKRHSASMFIFGGSSNTFDLTGVTIEVDTKLLSAFKDCYIREFLIEGNNNTIIGLSIKDIGNLPTDRGGNSLTVNGDNNTLQDVTLYVNGSYPYGYGDLLGKGGNSIVAGKKHSG